MFEQVILYHSVMDARSRFIRAYLAYKGIDFSLSVHEDWHNSQQIRALNPARTIPILKCTQATIVGVMPIVETVDENFAQGPMFGTTIAERAENRRLMDWFFLKFESEVYKPIMNVRYYQNGNVEVLKIGRKNMHMHLRYMTTLLDERFYLTSDKRGIADYCAGAYLSALDYFSEVPWADYPMVKEWYQGIKSQPCFRPILDSVVPSHTPPPHYKLVDF